MKARFLWLPAAAAALAVGAAACGDDDSGISADDARTQVREVAGNIQQQAEDLSTSIGDELDQHDLSEIDDATKDKWNQNCTQMTEEAKDEAARNKLRDACGDLRNGIEDNDEDAVREARDRIRDAADRVDNQ